MRKKDAEDMKALRAESRNETRARVQASPTRFQRSSMPPSSSRPQRTAAEEAKWQGEIERLKKQSEELQEQMKKNLKRCNPRR